MMGLVSGEVSSCSINLGGTTHNKSDNEDTVNNCKKDANYIEDGIFAMEDLGQPKEENQCGLANVLDLGTESITDPQGRSMQVIESTSVSKLSKVDNIQCDVRVNNEQNKEFGSDKKHGVKRLLDECKESSIHLVYNSLPSRSKRKLEELIRQWSNWHAQHCSSAEEPVDSLESGEETYFPALHVGSDKSSTLSFSMDVHVAKKQRNESLSLNNEGSPLYERGYAIGLASDLGADEERGVDLRDAPRCFNCGSFNHPLSSCPKPLDKAVVNRARKELQSKKNQSAGPRVPTRYYQDSPRGKYDGLKPGALSEETRKLLGLGELDPPPWLNRMRELGYPPGYLHSEVEDEPSGIAIYGDDASQNGGLTSDDSPSIQNSEKKLTVDFPGINAAIPEHANQNLWAASRVPVISDFSQNRSDNRLSYRPDALTNGNFHGAYGQWNPITSPSSPFGLGSSPPVPHHPHNHHPSEPFSPRGIPIPGSPHYGRPYMQYNYGTF